MAILMAGIIPWRAAPAKDPLIQAGASGRTTPRGAYVLPAAGPILMMRAVQVGIYGLGRFGVFWAAQLARHFAVCAYSRRLHRPPVGVRMVSEREVLRCPVVILCVAISALEEVVDRVAPHIRPQTLVMDTCSIKGFAAQVMERRLQPPVQILATHPMFGPDSAREGIAGQPMILCPVRISDGLLQGWRIRFAAMGLRVVMMTAEQHDREAALTQGITHYLGRVLAEMGLTESTISTVGYRKLREIMEQTCNDSLQLFLDLQRYNPFTAEMRERLERALSTVRAQLDTPPEQRASPP